MVLEMEGEGHRDREAKGDERSHREGERPQKWDVQSEHKEG